MKTPLQIRKEIGKRLKDARLTAGFKSAEEFANLHEIQLDLYLSHENGDKSIKASNAMKYCKLLHVSMDELLLGQKVERGVR